MLEHIVMCINLLRSGGKKQSEHDLSSGVRISKYVLFKSTNGPHFRLRMIPFNRNLVLGRNRKVSSENCNEH